MSSFHFFDKIVVRVPLLPFNRKFDSIESFINDPIIDRALFFSSRILHDEVQKIKLIPEANYSKITKSLLNYYQRMRTRCTPFGMNAACGTITWGKKTNINIDSRSEIIRYDMGYLDEIKIALETSKEVRKQLIYFSNNSVNIIGDKIKYIEDYYKGHIKYFRFSEINELPIIQEILKYCKNGRHYTSINNHINSKYNNINTRDLIEQLISNKLLYSELEPLATGSNYQEVLLKTLFRLQKDVDLKKILKVNNLLNYSVLLLKNNFKSNLDLNDSLNTIKELNANNTEGDKDIWQVDSYIISEKGQLNEEYKTQLLDALNFLNRITPSVQHRLFQFERMFQEKYEEQEISLLNVFDPISKMCDTSYNNPSLNSIFNEILESNNSDSSINIDRVGKILLRKMKGTEYIMQINDDDFKGIDYTDHELPPTMSVLFTIVSDKKINLYGFSGPSAVHMINRFTNDKHNIHKLSKEIIDFEKEYYSDKIIAEVVHIPQPRAGNIICAPNLREYEIPLLNRSVLKKEQQIPLNDIYLRISNNRLVLYSKKLNKEIIPRLSHAFQYNKSRLPIYRFLGDFQTYNHNKFHFKFDWRGVERLFIFKPRVEYKNIILSPARWDFCEETCSEIINLKEGDNLTLQKWQEKWKLPNIFMLISNETEIFIDLDCQFLRKQFINFVKMNKKITVFEFLGESTNLSVFDNNGNGYLSEFIAFIGQKMEEAESQLKKNPSIYERSNAKREFVPGEEWLYYKLYMSVISCERILVEVILPFVKLLEAKNMITKWFYVRYWDPDFHIRFRLRLSKSCNISNIIEEFNIIIKQSLEYNQLHKIVIDTYIREIERYGYNKYLISLSESFFTLDSLHTLNFISRYSNPNEIENRFLYSLGAIDDILTVFKFNQQEKNAIVSNLKRSLLNEHNNKENVKEKLSLFQRKFGKVVLQFFLSRSTLDLHKIIKKLLHLRQISTSKEISKYIDRIDKNKRIDLVTSYIHMMINRLLVDQPRIGELFIYDLLSKYYIAIDNLSKRIDNEGRYSN